MKRIKIFKAYFVLWLFVYFIVISNIDVFKLYFLSTLTFNIAIVSILTIGTIMLLKAAKDVVMLAGTFGVLMYKKDNLSFYIRGISKVLPSHFANKITSRAENGMLIFTQQEKEDILAWIEEQFSNQNKYNNFFIGTVLMIGLLGTFSGLLGAIGSMANIVMSLSGSNVDIGKIMAGFSGPLSSMAVGFGSSLFGVISAIILSIKGYLLNRSQASVLDGVENWLNSKIVNTDLNTNSENINEKVPSFIDIFVDKMDNLNSEINLLNKHNNLLHKKLEYFENKNEQVLEALADAMQKFYNKTSKTNEGVEKLLISNYQQSEIFTKIANLQQRELLQMSELNLKLEKYLSKKDNESKIVDFQIIESLQLLKKEIETIRDKTENSQNSNIEKNNFIYKHFGFKES